MRASITVEFIDRVSGKADKAARSFDKFEDEVREAERGVKGLARAQERMGSASERASRRSTDAIRRERDAIRARERELDKAAEKARRREARRERVRGALLRGGAALATAAIAAGGAAVRGAASDQFQADQLRVLTGQSEAQWDAYERELAKIGARRGIGTKGAYGVFGELMMGGMDAAGARDLADPVVVFSKATQAAQEDAARTAIALSNNLEIAPKAMLAAFDAMAIGAKEGQFEVRDMARDFPSLAAKYASLGGKGLKAVRAITAIAQQIRTTTGTSSEAATNFENMLDKLTAPDFIKNMDELGVSVEAVFKSASEKGLDPVLEILKQIERVTGGDRFKLAALLPDRQARAAVQAVLKDIEGIEAAMGRMEGASGEVMRDFTTATDNANSAWDRFASNVARRAKDLATGSLPLITKGMNALSDAMEDEGSKFLDPAAAGDPEAKAAMEAARDRGRSANRFFEKLFGWRSSPDTDALELREKRAAFPGAVEDRRRAREAKTAPRAARKKALDRMLGPNPWEDGERPVGDGLKKSGKEAEAEAKRIESRIDAAWAVAENKASASGETIGRQLAAGMRSAKGDVAAAASELANTASAHFPQSPAKRGPLRKLPDMGRKISRKLAGGMEDAAGARAASRIAARIAAGVSKPGKGAAATPSGARQVTVHTGPITITGVKDGASAVARLGASLESRLAGTLADVGRA